MNNYLICSYYTTNYKDIAYQYLIPSLEKLKLNNYVIEIPNLKGWKSATDYKPYFIKECLNKFKTDIVWIDCDAIVNKIPIFFDIMFPQYDLGVHYFDPKLFYNNSNKPPHVASGTLYLRDNNNIFKLIEDWINCCSSVKWEQMALQKAIEKNPEIKVYNLIREYCYIETQPNGKPPSHPIEFPIISHFQSSRKMRR